MIKKGFTLIELLAVIVIIGVIALIASPIVINTIKKSKKQAFARSMDGIVEAVKIDVASEAFTLPREYVYENGRLTLLSVGDDDKNENIKMNGKIEGSGYIHVDIDGDIIIDKLCDKSYCASNTKEKPNIVIGDSDGKPVIDPLDPLITLKGNKDIYITIESTYEELGVKSRTRSGEALPYTTIIKKGEEVVDQIDTTNVSIYTIIYTNESNGKRASVSRNVYVIEMTPVITMTEGSNQYVKEQSVLINVSAIKPNTVSSFTVEINKDGNSNTETVNGLSKIVTLNENGIYEVIVRVTDNNGHSSSLTKTYKIDLIPPELTVPENGTIKITEATSFDPKVEVTATDNSGIEPTIEVTGGLSAILGDYTITYKAIDEAGNETSKTRTITVVEADGPILNFSDIGGDTWRGESTIKLTATDNSNLQSFAYEIFKDDVSQGVENVEVSGKSAEKSITLNQDGTYKVKLTGSDEYGNTSTVESSTYKIDVTAPTAGTATFAGTLGSNGWYTSDITVNVADGSDALSGHKITTSNVSSITSNTNGTKVTITTTDQAGNTASREYTIKVDKTKPTLTLKNVDSATITEGDSVAVSSYYNTPTYSISSGSMSCNPTNTDTLESGTQKVTCTATGGNGLSTSVEKTVIVNTGCTGITQKPTITNGLVPIKWNGSKWIKADESNPEGANQWYDYCNQMWANAASVTSSYRNVAVGTEIPESEILAYFVWIPRYEYQYKNLGNNYAGGTVEQPGEIKLNFISTSKTTATTNYKIHPAFNFGGTEIPGIWVGKFETTGDATTPTIKPNLTSLRKQKISLQFTTAQKFSSNISTYGITSSADSHMMKNSEWGAVAYLSQSKYGKYGNNSYSGANKEVYINNNNGYTTGCSAGAPSTAETSSCTYTYEKSTGGTGASTSGTIYGVYDMNGGAWEYVMGVYRGSDASSIWGADNTDNNYAGFSSAPSSKYYDNYTTDIRETACNGGVCYGHALSEISGWYGDVTAFANNTAPWFMRGGFYSDKSEAGVFRSHYYVGNARVYNSFRVVLSGE